MRKPNAAHYLLCLSLLALGACGSSATMNGSSSTTTGSGTGGSGTGDAGAGTRTLTAFTSPSGKTVTTGFATTPGTCAQVTEDTSSCKAARQALGLSGNWLDFSCNVVEGLADASMAATTSMTSAKYVTLSVVSLPNYDSNYYATTGSYSFSAYGYTVAGDFQSLSQAYTTYYPDPSFNQVQALTVPIPLSPAAAASKSQVMVGGPIGVARNGVILYDSAAGGTDSIFAESGSFDQCGGHPNAMTYHYHAEPYALSYDDSALIGVMRDGYFVYGRRDSDGSTPGTIAAQVAGGSGDTNLIYIYGGHTGTAPSSSDANGFHYHLTEWKGCFDETVPSMSNHMPTKNSDDATTYDAAGTFNTPASTTCNGTWADSWFISGHGNGGVFAMTNASLTTQSPSQTVAAIRYYYGTPATCTACMGK
jgi:hypothetical protein